MGITREPVVINKMVLESGGKGFQRHEDSINWIVAEGVEEEVAAKVLESRARSAVIGPFRYRNKIYAALSQNTKGGPSLLARFGVGYDGVDLGQCKRYNVMLTITPHTLNRSVAEHVMALLLSLGRHIPYLDRTVRDGDFEALKGIELHGKSLGIAGFGAIGKTLSTIASTGFGMKIFTYDKLTLETQAEKQGISPEEFMKLYGIEDYMTDFAEFARKISILSIHLPAAKETENFFDEARLALLKDGTILINTSRGSVIEERALFAALRSGKLKGAGIDVFAQEPYQPTSTEYDLRQLPNVILTPHVASNTFEAREQMALRVVKNIQHYLRKEYEQLDRVM